MTATNIIVDKGGSNQITVLSTSLKEKVTKKLQIITPAQPSGQWSLGPKDTKIVDLLRLEERYTIVGYVATEDRDKLLNISRTGGVTVWEIYEDEINVNMDTCEVETLANDQIDQPDGTLFVTITGIKGQNI